MTTSTPLEAQVDLYCRELKLPGIRRVYREMARDSLDKGLEPTQFLAACLAQELESRKERRLQNLLKYARFPVSKTLDTFDFTQIPSLPKAKVLKLAGGDFIRARENVICVGSTGTGKTHIAIALGMAAIQENYRVRFISAMQLSQELLQAQEELRLPRYLKTWAKVDLAIVDELGYLGLGTGGPLLFQFCAERYESGSLMMTTNLEFSRWGEVFGDATLTSALLDRLTHHVHVLSFNGESYRFRQSTQQNK